jgi:hypothetical protein
MRRVAAWVLAGTVASLSAVSAAAEPKSPATPSATPPGADDERVFEAEAERYERLREFTLKLVREREQRAFEEAAEHYARLSKLTRSLAEAASVAQERAFDAEVELYLKKRALTRELSAPKPLPSPPPLAPSAPAW